MFPVQVWALSSNKITALNSFKMKISVIFGVSQMTLGVILSIINHRYWYTLMLIGYLNHYDRYTCTCTKVMQWEIICTLFFPSRFFNRKVNIYCEFIPQVIFLASIFGYLVCEIFIKWIVFSVKDSTTAPNLLIGTQSLAKLPYCLKPTISNMNENYTKVV